MLYTHVHSNMIHNSQKVETTQISINRWVDMQKNMIYTYNRHDLVAKWQHITEYYSANPNTWYNIDELWHIRLSEIVAV